MSSQPYELTTEFFAIPYEEDTYLLYSPLKQILMLANASMVDLVASLRDGEFAGVNAENMDALELLLGSGAVNGPPDEPPLTAAGGPWKPTEVTLFLTNACNLRCTYCYASAGDYRGSMAPETALAAVERVAANARELGEPGFRVSYHGGGEPTLAWETLRRSTHRARELAEQHGLDVQFSLATNGVLPSWKVEWLVRHIHDFSISYDGPGEFQDQQRPTTSGRGSSETVEATFRHLDCHGASYGIRMTVTRETVTRLPEMIEYILERYAPGRIHVEPMFRQGRARHQGLAPPDARTFVDRYRQADEVARRHGHELYYSGARADLITDAFCGVPAGSFNVTPEGQLTSCFEVCHPDDELADQFFYGKVVGVAPAANHSERDSGGDGGCQSSAGKATSTAKGLLHALPVVTPEPAATGRSPNAARDGAPTFHVDDRQLAALAGHTVSRRPECDHCFCKWHCAGDCSAKNLISDSASGEQLKDARCLINQQLTRDQLVRRLRQGSRMMRQIAASRADLTKGGF